MDFIATGIESFCLALVSKLILFSRNVNYKIDAKVLLNDIRFWSYYNGGSK